MASATLEGMKSNNAYSELIFIDNIGNYKGVMLCTRPNESIGLPKERY